MPALPELQHAVFDALLGRGGDAAVLRRVREPAGVPAARRLQIYRNNLFESLGDALAAVYPVTARLVGADFFRQMAQRFIRSHPSRAGDLLRFGAALPSFLRSFGPTASLPYLPDVAALEWAWHEAYHAAEEPPLAPARLAEVPAASQLELRLVVQPSARFVASAFPVLAIWRANQPERLDDEAAMLSLDQGGDRLLVVQHALDVEIRVLGLGEDRLLRALADGGSLALAAQSALGADPGFDLGSALGRHLSRGLFTGLRVDEEHP